MVGPDREVNSLAQYVQEVIRIALDWSDEREYVQPWFRGVGSALKYKLQPRLYRDPEINPLQQEAMMRVEFTSRAPAFVEPTRRREAWDWYFLMQHYGVPTRLLDWTESALVACYFALSTNPDNVEEPPGVWVLNPLELNKITIMRGPPLRLGDEELDKYLPASGACVSATLPAAVLPMYTDRRMDAQQSKFTVHGSSTAPIEETPQLSSLLSEGHLIRLVLKFDDEERGSWSRQLAVLGTLNSSVFPDLGGLSKDITEWYTTLA